MNFKDKPHYVIQVAYTLVRQRMGEFVFLFYASIPYMVFQTKRLAERNFFSP